MANNTELSLEPVDITELAGNTDELPPLPPTEPEFNEDPTYNASSENRIQEYVVDDKGDVQNYDDNIDWGSLQPVDESGFANPQEPDYDSLTPYDVGQNPNRIWEPSPNTAGN